MFARCCARVGIRCLRRFERVLVTPGKYANSTRDNAFTDNPSHAQPQKLRLPPD